MRFVLIVNTPTRITADDTFVTSDALEYFYQITQHVWDRTHVKWVIVQPHGGGRVSSFISHGEAVQEPAVIRVGSLEIWDQIRPGSSPAGTRTFWNKSEINRRTNIIELVKPSGPWILIDPHFDQFWPSYANPLFICSRFIRVTWLSAEVSRGA